MKSFSKKVVYPRQHGEFTHKTVEGERKEKFHSNLQNGNNFNNSRQDIATFGKTRNKEGKEGCYSINHGRSRGTLYAEESAANDI